MDAAILPDHPFATDAAAAPAQYAAEVLVPVPLRARYTYLLPAQPNRPPQVGKRVLVPFGKNKLYAGIVTALHPVAPGAQLAAHQLRMVQEVLDDAPVVTPQQIALFDWMADYYLCSPGEVLKAALPTGLKLSSELQVELAPGTHPGQWDAARLPEREFLLLEAIAVRGSLDADEVAKITGLANPRPLLQRMAQRGMLVLNQVVEPSYREKTLRCLQLSPALADNAEALRAAFDDLRRAPQQEAALLVLAEAQHQGVRLPERDVLQRIGAGSGVARALVQRGYAQALDVPVARAASEYFRARRMDDTLTPDQETALAEIRTAGAPPAPGEGGGEPSPKPVLLHGVTGSGKTLLYIERMRDVLAAGRQALYLLPEIALTRQVVDKVKSALGPTVGVYHSRINAQERVEIWQRVLSGEYRAVIGVRSAILLPFDDLGLIVVDEEHDASFKQTEPNPRYHARDVAVWYGATFRVPVILGSATPSLESWDNALQGKYHRVSLPQRVGAARPPGVQFVDMRLQAKAHTSHGQFSDVLLQALRDTLARGEQAIVFKNRRGFSPLLHCEHCGHVPQCPNCDISLTYHKAQHTLRCHYCGYADDIVDRCAVCDHPDLRPEGIGTERLEEQLTELLPEARIARMDLDTTRGKEAFNNLIARIEQRQVDIVVGTQMVTKGLDFDNVTLAAVVQADQMLGWPDFRAHEYAYQLLTQLAGRTGRGSKPGTVLIQTRQPEHPVLALVQQPYERFFAHEAPQRQLHGYPPYGRLIRIELRHRDRDLVQRAGTRLAAALGRTLPGNVLGPEFPYVARLRQLFRQHLLVKIPRGSSLALARTAVQRETDALRRDANFKQLQIVLDVDPR